MDPRLWLGIRGIVDAGMRKKHPTFRPGAKSREENASQASKASRITKIAAPPAEQSLENLRPTRSLVATSKANGRPKISSLVG